MKLTPTIVQDESSQVLMLAFSSEESLKKTLETGNAWYFSRKRKKLWNKGETSGNFQKIISVKADCDKDALLFKVRQTGNACHTGSYSCFGEREFSLNELAKTVRQRKINPKEGSYTSKIFSDKKGAVNKICEKVGEEAAELIIAAKDGKKEEITSEMADLFYFCTLLLAEKDIEFGEIIKELESRKSS